MHLKEPEVRADMSETRLEVLKEKRLASIERLIKASGHQDNSLAQDLSGGFDLTEDKKFFAATCDLQRCFVKIFDP